MPSVVLGLTSNQKIRFYGRGKAHGVGMSMAGVYSLALRHKKKYGWILRHYYKNIGFSKRSDLTKIKVKCIDGKIRLTRIKDYLYRLAEEPDDWPMEGLKTLMVAARSYLWYKLDRYGYMPGGQYYIHTINPKKRPRTVAAVKATQHLIATYNKQPILAAYCSSSGGITATLKDIWGGNNLPYLTRVVSPWDKVFRKTWYWRQDVKVSAIEKAFPSLGGLKAINIISKNKVGSWGGRVLQIRLVGKVRSITMSGWSFAGAVGLKSSWFTYRVL